MTNATYLEAFLFPHIRKYMMRKLCPATASTTPNGLQIQRDMAKLIPLRIVECEPQEDRHRPIQRLRLMVALPELRDLDPLTRRQVNVYAEETYLWEFCSTVDRLVYNAPGMEIQTAIFFFRDQYGIDEDDLRYETSRITYYKYEIRKGRKKRRGGGRSRSGPKAVSDRSLRRRPRTT